METHELTLEEKQKLEKPVIAKPFPYTFPAFFNQKIIIQLKEGETYSWCSCGLSKKQPFCDGSHKGTKFKPIVFKHDKKTKLALICGCKRNDPSAGPYCDGSHSCLDW